MTDNDSPDQTDDGPAPGPLGNLKQDGAAGVVVFLVALPLCLGIALASGAPLMSGLITGITGGLLVSWLSGSKLAVSGPAAGLTTIVLAGIDQLGYEAFLLAVMFSGVVQLCLGAVRAGVFGYYFPNTVIRGMLSAIGIILILKQIPHAFGNDADWLGDLDFSQADGKNTITEILGSAGLFEPGAVIIAFLGLVILVGMPKIPALASLKLLPPPLVVVLVGVGLNQAMLVAMPEWALGATHLVQIPVTGPVDFIEALRFPDFSAVTNTAVYTTALTIAAVASIETLLCIEAIDKLDPYRRRSNTDRELLAQGAGNMVAGLFGGIPMTAVIVRGSANVQAGGRTPMSSFLHGVLLLVSILAIPFALNLIPLAALAAILLHIGYKLAPIGLMREMWRSPRNLAIPYFVTVVAILFTDLLTGVGLGLAVGIAFVLWANYQSAYSFHVDEKDDEDDVHRVRVELGEHVSFLSKAPLHRFLHELPEGAEVLIDGSKTEDIHHDILDILDDFQRNAAYRGITMKIEGLPSKEAAA